MRSEEEIRQELDLTKATFEAGKSIGWYEPSYDAVRIFLLKWVLNDKGEKIMDGEKR